jgi:hypothetical protein
LTKFLEKFHKYYYGAAKYQFKGIPDHMKKQIVWSRHPCRVIIKAAVFLPAQNCQLDGKDLSKNLLGKPKPETTTSSIEMDNIPVRKKKKKKKKKEG